MYNLQSLLGKVVTIKSHKGDEVIGKLMGFNDDGTILTVYNPKIVVIANEDVVLIPFALTAKTQEVHLHLNQIFTVLETLEVTSKEYLKLIAEEEELASGDDEDDDEDEA